MRSLLLSWQAQCSSSDATVEQQRQEIERLRTEVVQVPFFFKVLSGPTRQGLCMSQTGTVKKINLHKPKPSSLELLILIASDIDSHKIGV